MEDQKVLINVPPDYNGTPITIKWMEGHAGTMLDEVQEKKIVENGIITAPAEYIMKHHAHNLASGILQPGIVKYSLNRDKLFIFFDEFPAHPHKGAKISGNIEMNPELNDWQINKGVSFTEKDFIKLIRKQAHNFANLDDAKQLIKTLQNFEATFTTTRKEADDRSGNKESAIIEKLKIKEGELMKVLRLSIPIFKGGQEVTLDMDVEIDRVKDSIGYSFYSLDIEKVIRETAKDTIMESIAAFKPAFVCIEQA